MFESVRYSVVFRRVEENEEKRGIDIDRFVVDFVRRDSVATLAAHVVMKSFRDSIYSAF